MVSNIAVYPVSPLDEDPDGDEKKKEKLLMFKRKKVEKKKHLYVRNSKIALNLNGAKSTKPMMAKRGIFFCGQKHAEHIEIRDTRRQRSTRQRQRRPLSTLYSTPSVDSEHLLPLRACHSPPANPFDLLAGLLRHVSRD